MPGMVLLGPALLCAVMVGYLLGGRLHRLADARLTGVALIATAAVLQGVPALAARLHRPLADGVHVGVVLASLGALLAFTLLNRRVRGMAIAAGGVLANAVVLAANGAMPVSLAALRSVRPRLVELPSGVHRAMPDGGRLGFLGDVIPLAPMNTVVSAGDMLLVLGTAIAVVALMTGRPLPQSPAAIETGLSGDAASGTARVPPPPPASAPRR
jgi:hypothetical protein